MDEGIALMELANRAPSAGIRTIELALGKRLAIVSGHADEFALLFPTTFRTSPREYTPLRSPA